MNEALQQDSDRRNMRSRVTVLNNLLMKYGKKKVLKLLLAFERLDSGEVIAKEYGVTRERVRQWKMLLGYEIKTYVVHPDILARTKA